MHQQNGNLKQAEQELLSLNLVYPDAVEVSAAL